MKNKELDKAVECLQKIGNLDFKLRMSATHFLKEALEKVGNKEISLEDKDVYVFYGDSMTPVKKVYTKDDSVMLSLEMYESNNVFFASLDTKDMPHIIYAVADELGYEYQQ